MRLWEKFHMEGITKNTELHPRKVRKILDTTQDINVIANIIFAEDNFQKYEIRAKSPKQYINEFSKKNERMEKTLENHFIKREWGIDDNNYDLFIEKRSREIANKLNAILNPKL